VPVAKLTVAEAVDVYPLARVAQRLRWRGQADSTSSSNQPRVDRLTTKQLEALAGW
jgi:hypothetical protein